MKIGHPSRVQTKSRPIFIAWGCRGLHVPNGTPVIRRASDLGAAWRETNFKQFVVLKAAVRSQLQGGHPSMIFEIFINIFGFFSQTSHKHSAAWPYWHGPWLHTQPLSQSAWASKAQAAKLDFFLRALQPCCTQGRCHSE